MLRLAELRKSKGITQKELADKLGVTQKTISTWELGTREPSIESLIWLCHILQTTIDNLVNNPNVYSSPDSATDEGWYMRKAFFASLQKASPLELEKMGEMMNIMFPHLKPTVEKGDV